LIRILTNGSYLHMHCVASVKSILSPLFLYTNEFDQMMKWLHDDMSEEHNPKPVQRRRKHGTPSTLPANKSLKIHQPRLVLVLPRWFQPAQSERQSLLSTFLGSSLHTSTHSVLCKMHATSSKTVFLLQLPWEVDLARGNSESVDGPTWPCSHAFLHMGSYTCIVWPHCDALHPFIHESVISQFLCLKCTCI
jgi:hypothetical protein